MVEGGAGGDYGMRSSAKASPASLGATQILVQSPVYFPSYGCTRSRIENIMSVEYKVVLLSCFSDEGIFLL